FFAAPLLQSQFDWAYQRCVERVRIRAPGRGILPPLDRRFFLREPMLFLLFRGIAFLLSLNLELEETSEVFDFGSPFKRLPASKTALLGVGCFDIDRAFGDLGELLVGGAFLVQGFLEELGDFLLAE